MRARTNIEEHVKTGRKSIVTTEIPYQVNKAKLIEKIAELVRDKRIDGIADIRDESDRDGMRMVIDLKKDAVPEVVLNNLWKMTPMQDSFGINMLAIVEGRPQTLSLKKLLQHFIAHRRDVVGRRTMFELRQARERMHILEGLKIAVDNIDAVIDLIRSSKDTETAKSGLIETLRAVGAPGAGDPRHAPGQADRARARRADRGDQGAGGADRAARGDPGQRDRADGGRGLGAGADQVGSTPIRGGRRSIDIAADIDIEDMIAPEEMVVTVTHGGYVKRNPKSLYKAQRRGGRGITGAATHEEDFVAQLFVASTHDTLLMFTSKGRAYTKKVWEVPQAGRTAKGKAFVNLIPLQENERVVAMLPVREFSEGAFVVMATRAGQIKKTSLNLFANIRSSGIIALSIADNDDLVGVRITEGASDVLLGTRDGWAIRFREENVRPMGRTARGVRGIKLRQGSDEVVGMAVIPRDAPSTLLTVCERGYGKRTPVSDYPTKNRGGKGVITIKTSERNGKVVGLRLVTDEDDLMLITNGGKLIRMPVNGIPTIGRNTQGVRLIRLETDEQVVAMERMAEKEEGESEVAPEVAAARAEAQSEPLAEEDLGEEGGDDEDALEADAESDDDDDDDGRWRRRRRQTAAADNGEKSN